MSEPTLQAARPDDLVSNAGSRRSTRSTQSKGSRVSRASGSNASRRVLEDLGKKRSVKILDFSQIHQMSLRGNLWGNLIMLVVLCWLYVFYKFLSKAWWSWCLRGPILNSPTWLSRAWWQHLRYCQYNSKLGTTKLSCWLWQHFWHFDYTCCLCSNSRHRQTHSHSCLLYVEVVG